MQAQKNRAPFQNSADKATWLVSGWRDRLALLFAWAAGLGLCAIAAAIVIYMGYRGIQYLRPGLLFTRPAISTAQSIPGRRSRLCMARSRLYWVNPRNSSIS